MKSGLPAFSKAVRRYALVIDAICGAALALVAIKLGAGIGVVGSGSLLTLLIILAWVGIETVLARARRRSAIRP